MDVVQSQGEQRNEDSLDQSQGAGQSQFGQSQSRGHEENRGQEGNDKEWLEWRNDRFALKNGVQVWLYVSALPVSSQISPSLNVLVLLLRRAREQVLI